MDRLLKILVNGEIALLNGQSIIFDTETGRREKYEKLATYEDKQKKGLLAEVIRCKDCMYKGKWTDFCVHFTQEDSVKNIRVKDDDYCSYGVKKEVLNENN